MSRILALCNDDDTLSYIAKYYTIPRLLMLISDETSTSIDEFPCHAEVNPESYDALIFVFNERNREQLRENLSRHLTNFLTARKKTFIVVLDRSLATLYEVGAVEGIGPEKRAEITNTDGGP